MAYWQDIFPMCHRLVPYLCYIIWFRTQVPRISIHCIISPHMKTTPNDLMDFHFYITSYVYYDNVKLETQHIPFVNDLCTITGMHNITLSSANYDFAVCKESFLTVSAKFSKQWCWILKLRICPPHGFPWIALVTLMNML